MGELLSLFLVIKHAFFVFFGGGELPTSLTTSMERFAAAGVALLLMLLPYGPLPGSAR